MDRIKKTVTQGSVGFLAGFFLERGIEITTGFDFVDGVLEIAGATIGVANANKDIVQGAYDSIKRMFGKEPLELTREEWQQYKVKYPNAAKFLEEALAI